MSPAADLHELIGVIPAAGRATRLGHLPCSKEVLPIGWELGPNGRPRAVVACEPLLRQMHRAGASRAFVVVGTGKWDVPAFLEDGERVGLDLAYLVIENSPSTAPPWPARAVISETLRPSSGSRISCCDRTMRWA